jgi:hypothetical protein
MRRAAVPIFRAVVPGVTQIPANFGDVTYHTPNTSRSFSEWEDPLDHQVISAGSLHDIPSTTIITTATTTTTSTSTSLDDYLHSDMRDSAAMVHRVSDVFRNLDMDYSNATSAALVQVVQDTTRDPQIVGKIMGLASFQNFVSSIPANYAAVENRPRYNAIELSEPEEEIPSFLTHAGTQTGDDDFTDSLESRLQYITMQIAPDLGLAPPVSTATSTSSPSTSSTVSPAIVPATHIESSTPIEESVGDAGVPGKTSPSIAETAVKVIIPLAILAVAAAMLPIPRAVDLLKTGFKYVSRMLTKIPA